MDIGPALVWVAAISSCLGLGTTIWNLLTSGSKANAKKLTEAQADIIKLAGRVGALEGRIDNMPSQQAVHQLDLKVSELSGSVNVVAESLQAVQRSAHRIEEFLLSQAKK